jgi:hypothetical protein
MSSLTAYASSSARDSGSPAASNPGLCIFRTDTKAIEVSDGTNWLVYNYDAIDSPYLIDAITTSNCAYSLRQLSSTASNCIRVRRSSDNTEQDIGFSSNALDTSSLTSFVGSNDGFITKWYDQSGNSVDAAQTTAANQPKIVSSGSVITEGGKPAISFDGSNDYLALSSTLSLSTEHSIFAVAQTNDTTAVLVGSTSPTSNFNTNSSTSYAYNANGYFQAIGSSSPLGHQAVSIIRNAGTVTVYKNGSSFGSNSTFGSNAFTVKEVGRRANLTSLPWDGTMQELIFYPTDKTSDLTTVDSDINNFYSIY